MQAGTVYPFFGHAISSTELLVAGAVLLAIAAVMLAFGRRQRIALHRSPVTEELALHLSRIADVLERQAMRPIQPVQSVFSEPSKRPEEGPKRIEATPLEEPSVAPRPIPYSMFGR